MSDRITNACQGCTERCVGCHGDCERYALFRERLDHNNDVRRKANEENSYFVIKGNKIRKAYQRRGDDKWLK